SSSETGRVATVRDTYPFHPKYIEVLHEFVTRNKDLQKTRDAIRITRKVVRRVLRGAEDPDLIMPWHIDLRDGDIRNRVLTDSYKEFRDVASRDLVSDDGRLGSVAECTKPQLALRIATPILLKTYTYETFEEPLKVFPDLKTVALMAYEPGVFTSEGWQIGDIRTTLEELEGRLPHLACEEGRYWFTPYPSVIEYVERKAEEKLRGPKLALYQALKGYVDAILVRREGRKAAVEEGEVFRKEDTIVIGYGDDYGRTVRVEDEKRMKLVVLIKPGVKIDDVRKIILERPEGGRRIYANTVAAIYPAQNADFDLALRYVATIEASEEIMNTLGEYYRDREILGLQERKLKGDMDVKVKELSGQLLNLLTRVAYPKGGDIEEGEATPSTSIISQAEALLKDTRTGEKLRTEIKFEDLVEFLRNLLKWDLVEGDRRFEFREILDIFYTNPAAPFTTRKAVERSILSGLEDIGIKAGERLYWKKIGEKGAEKPEGIKDGDEVLPYRFAAEMLKQKLLSETGIIKELEGAKRVWYEVEVAGRRIPFTELVEMRDWELTLKAGLILRMEELIPRGFILEVKPSQVDIEPGKSIELNINIEPVGDYAEEVSLTVSGGSLDKRMGNPPLNIAWRIEPPLDPGKYIYTVKATGKDGTAKEGQLLVTVLSPEIDIEIDGTDLERYLGAKLLAITLKEITPIRLCLNVAPSMDSGAKADVEVHFGEEASFNGENMDVNIARRFVDKFNDILGSIKELREKTTIRGVVRFKDPPTLDNVKIKLLPFPKARFKLRVKREAQYGGR
ncbi:MAG: DUF499 domain-containing protein, partial [Candidatus Bathyarchaeia archaeon]